MLRRDSDKNEALINYQDVVFGKVLGSGGFGEVYHGTWRHNDVAIKKLLMKKITSESAQEFEAESQIMARLRSPNIVQFYGYAIEPERCIVMEYCPNGSLFSVLHSNQPLEWTVRIKIALGAVKGLAFLHEEKILHRDIKSLNILLTEHFEAKLTDFGLSKVKAETKSHTLATKTNTKDSVGTVQWMAPELFSRKPIFTQKSDIYSLGVTFWELASMQIPFTEANRDVIPMLVLQGEREDIPTDCPPTFGSLIQQCWAGDPSARPDTNAIITQLKNSLEAFPVPKASNAPSPNPSPFPVPSGPQYFSNLVSEEAPKPVALSLPTTPQITEASPEAVAVFVRLVAEGEQDQAEALLQKDRTLALLLSDVTDLSGRTFKGITGFQYAVWALDWHMWTMIRKYLPNDEARAQLQAMASASWVKPHGQSASWQNLLDAQQKVIGLCDKSQWDAASTCWQREVGGAQRLLLVHVINEYCHPTRSFDPCPDFSKSDPLPRTRNIDKGEWFTATYNGGKLGEKFGTSRGRWDRAWAYPLALGGGRDQTGLQADHKSCHTLLITRTRQRDQLVAELSSFAQKTSNAPSPNPSPFPAPSAPQYLSNLVSEDAPKPLVFSPPLKVNVPQLKAPVIINTPKLQPVPPIKQASPQAVAVFVRLIAAGEQDQAEALLQKDRTLALLSSDVIDLSGRIFKGITGFQYAVWALDWHMWTMIRKYLPVDKAAEQIKAMDKGPWVPQHSKSGDWLIQNLLDALQIYINLYKQSKIDEAKTQWQTKVGGAQHLLPVHAINEYCHPNRPFHPRPDFTKSDLLPRTRRIMKWGDEGEWFTTNGDKIGVERGAEAAGAVCSGEVVHVLPWKDAGGLKTGPEADHRACYTLLATRTQQRDALIAELLNNKPLVFSPTVVSTQARKKEKKAKKAPAPVVKTPKRPPPPSPSQKDLLLKTLQGHSESIYYFQLLPSGEVASCSTDKTIKIWDIRTGTCLRTLSGHTNWITYLQLLSTGELVSASKDLTIRVWDPKTGYCLKTLTGHTHEITCLQLLLNGELASGSKDGTIKIWNLKKGKCRKTWKDSSEIKCFQQLPSGELVSCSGRSYISIWDLKKGKCLKILKGSYYTEVYRLQLLPNSELLSCDRTRQLEIWDLKTDTSIPLREGKHNKAVYFFQFLPSGELVTSSLDGYIEIWDLKTRLCLKAIQAHTEIISAIQLLPGGELVSASHDKTLKIWDLKTGTCLKTLEGHTALINCIQLLPSGELVSGSGDSTLKVWDLTEFSLAPAIEEKRGYSPRQ